MRRLPAFIPTFALLAALALPLALPAPRAAADEAETSTASLPSAASRVAQVTLYQDQAWVVREVQVGAPGTVVVTGLPAGIQPGSLVVESLPKGLEVRSVRFRTRAVEAGEDPAPMAALLNREKELRRATRENGHQVELAKARLAGCEQVALGLKEARSADAKALAETLGLLAKERSEAMAALVAAETEADRLGAAVADLQREKERLGRSQAKGREVREAVLEVAGAGAGGLRLAYRVDDCGWAPAYTVRADEKDGRALVNLVGRAVIRQGSGEDWNGVSLVLSTATPAVGAAAPLVGPLTVALTSDAARQQMAQADHRNGLRGQISEANRRFLSGNDNLLGQYTRSSELNVLTNASLCNDWMMPSDEDAAGVRPADAAVVELALPSPVSLPTRQEPQSVKLCEAELRGASYRVAAPALGVQVFREAALTLDGLQDCMGGPVEVYMGGRFVGRTELPSLTRGQPFVLGLGVDPTLRVHRETLSSVPSGQGGNTTMTVKSRVSVDHFGAAPALLRLVERMPDPLAGADVVVNLTEPGQPLSKDEAYLRVGRPRGLLRWDLEVPAKGAEAKVFEYTWTETHQRGLVLAPADQRVSRQAFDELQQKQQLRGK